MAFYTPTPGLSADLRYGGTTSAYASMTSIAGVTSASVNLDCDEHDVTPITSNGSATYIPGKTSATIQFELAFDRGQNTDDTNIHATLLSDWNTRGTAYYALQFSDTDTATSATDIPEPIIAAGFITSLSASVSPDAAQTASVTLRLTGVVDTSVSTATEGA